MKTYRWAVSAATAVAVVVVAGACSRTVADPSDEVWAVTRSLPIVALDDAMGVFIRGGGYSSDGHETVTYVYAYRTDRGSIRQATTATLGLPWEGAPPLPVDVFEDVEPGQARVDVLDCSTGLWDLLGLEVECAEPGRVEIHVPAGSVQLGVGVDGPGTSGADGEPEADR